MCYSANSNRYGKMKYNRCGKSGLLLPALSLGLWKNFGSVDIFEKCRLILHKAFDYGITHFDLANNYGPVYGSAEETLGKVMTESLKHYRDEIIISTKAGYDMWPGPYGNWGSKKHLLSSLDQSLKRMNLEYVDIFYHHRPDPLTPMEETMGALEQAVRSGKALYAAVSNYSPEETSKAKKFMAELKAPLILHQGRYSMIDRKAENGLLSSVEDSGMGFIAFSPLAQGLLTGKYLNGIPENSRAVKFEPMKNLLTDNNINKAKALSKIAFNRGQKLSEMALAWVLKDKRVTSAIIGVSSPEQLEDNLAALDNLEFSEDEITEIEKILAN